MPEKREGDLLPGEGMKPVEGEIDCVLCGRRMLYERNLFTHVCLNEEHGTLAYYSPDECYFTAQDEVALRFTKEGKKFHLIDPDVLKAMGAPP